MRAILFISAIVACLFYGLAFDAVVGGLFDGLVCRLWPGEACLLPAQADRWIACASILFVIPLGCYVLLQGFFRALGALRSITLFGLLVVAP